MDVPGIQDNGQQRYTAVQVRRMVPPDVQIEARGAAGRPHETDLLRGLLGDPAGSFEAFQEGRRPEHGLAHEPDVR